MHNKRNKENMGGHHLPRDEGASTSRLRLSAANFFPGGNEEDAGRSRCRRHVLRRIDETKTGCRYPLRMVFLLAPDKQCQ